MSTYTFAAGGWRLGPGVTNPDLFPKAKEGETIARTYRAEASRVRADRHRSDDGRLAGLKTAGQAALDQLQPKLDANASWHGSLEARRAQLLAAVAPPDAVTEARAVEIRAALRRLDPAARTPLIREGIEAQDKELLLALWRDPARRIEPMVNEKVYAERIDVLAPRFALTDADAAKLAEVETELEAATVAHEVLVTAITRIQADMTSASGGTLRDHSDDARRAELLAQSNAAAVAA